MLLLRWLKRRAAFREEDFEDTLLAIFYTKDGKPDTSLSVYEIAGEAPQVVQTHAEHAIGCLSSPPRQFVSVDVAGFSGPNKATTQGTTGFKFTADAHRELRFDSADALRAFVRGLCDASPHRTIESPSREIRSYAKDRQAAQDPEWVGVCVGKKDWEKWMRKKDDEGGGPSQTPKSESTAARPSGSEPSGSDVIAADVPATEPSATMHGGSEPRGNEVIAAEVCTTEPGATELSAITSSGSEHSGSEVIAAEVRATEPSAAKPSADKATFPETG
ncbi:hypothetical protein [Polyangium spumosum]|uniref:Uncharacterized protein n=1 Tax=Polyangium spumosum TaxID=889282 RepID=A0A6N7Q4K3_9BACT|nr:hypothetical protein [Polyangium spumosum]MRG98176.1 hypothetical protein [Polyangium spumosum]